MCDHNHVLAGTRPIKGVTVKVNCQGKVSVLDQRFNDDPLRPVGLRHYQDTPVYLEAADVDCLDGQMGRGQAAAWEWVRSLTPGSTALLLRTLDLSPLIHA